MTRGTATCSSPRICAHALTAVAILALAGSAVAATLSLPDAQRRLLEANPDLAAATLEQVKNARVLDEAKALWYPNVDLVGSYTWFTEKNSIATDGLAMDSLTKLVAGIASGSPSVPTSMTATRTTEIGLPWRAEAGLDIGYPVTQAFVNLNNVRYRTLGMRTKDAQNAALRNQLSFKLGLAYLAWQFATEQTEVHAALIEQLTQYVAQLQNQRAGGVVSQARVLEAQARLQMAQVDLLAAQNLGDSLRLEVQTLIGAPELNDQPTAYDFPLDSAQWASLDTISMSPARPELAAIDSAVAQFKALDLIASGQKYPNLVLFAGYRYANPGLNMGSDEFMHYGLAGAQLKWNLFDGFRVRNQRLQSRQQTAVLMKNRESLLAAFERQRGQCLLQIRKAAAQEHAAAAALSAAEALAADLKNSLDAGVVTAVDHLNALAQVSRTRLAVKQAVFARKAALLHLYFAAGRELRY